MRNERVPTRVKLPPIGGGGLGAYLLPAPVRRGASKTKEPISPPAVPPSSAAEVEAGLALPTQARFPLPERWRGMFSQSPTFCASWQQAASVAFSEHRLLIRARRLIEILAQTRTTRFRMERHGLKAFCRLGCRTTLYRLSEVLAIYVVAANKPLGLMPAQLIPDLEQIVVDGLRETYGPEVQAKDLTDIMGGSKSRDFAISAKALVPSIEKHRCVLFPLQILERAVEVMAAQNALAGVHKQDNGRTR